MTNDLPLSVARYVKTLPVCSRAMAYLCLDNDNVVINRGGALEKCGMPSIEKGVLISEQLPAIAQLLPIGEKAVVLVNTQISTDTIIDLHLFADTIGQWVLIIDNTEAGLILQSEQQERLCNDIIKEKNTKNGGAR